MKNYLVDCKDGSFTIKAQNLKEARHIAQMTKRAEKLKGRVSVRLLKN